MFSVLTQRPERALALFFALIAAALRLWLWTDQVLIDDEWHAVHQVFDSSYAQIATSFGLADYSIPLTLAYKFLAETVGLTEWCMRLPMMLAGITFVALAVWWCARTFSISAAIVFGTFLVVSPLLFTYARIARPYGLTILLSALAVGCFLRYWHTGFVRWGVAYASCAVLATWLHLLIAPMVFAPLLFYGRAAWSGERIRWWGLAVPVGVLTLACVGPPLLLNPNALAEKTAVDVPTLDTLWSATFQWTGMGHTALNLAVLCAALLGARTVWLRGGAAVRIWVLGIGLTLAAIAVLRPAFVFVPLTFARYLLPVLPLLLLAAAVGVALAVKQRTLPSVATAVLVAGATFTTSTLRDMLSAPQSYAHHSALHFDVRRTGHEMQAFYDAAPQSPLWSKLTPSSAGPLRIAAAPWSLYSFSADHLQWQRASGQVVLPASMQGICTGWVPGHPRPNSGVRLRNFVFAANDEDLRRSQIDVLVLAKPYARTRVLPPEQRPMNLMACVPHLSARFGPPMLEDDLIVAFDLRRRYSKAP